jgi:hypothetical protein
VGWWGFSQSHCLFFLYVVHVKNGQAAGNHLPGQVLTIYLNQSGTIPQST